MARQPSPRGSRTPARAASSGTPNPAPPIDMKAEDMIAIWSKAIDTQMHFNEMATKSRQLGLAFVAAALGVGLVLLGQGEDFSLRLGGGWKVHVTVFIIAAGVLALAAVRKLDLGVYHQMLRGAVAFGEDFEEAHMRRLFQLDKGMTQAISHFSRHSDAEAKGPRGSHYAGSNYKDAGQKVGGFYNLSMIVLAVSALTIFGVTNAPSTSIDKGQEEIESQPTAPAVSTGDGATGDKVEEPVAE